MSVASCSGEVRSHLNVLARSCWEADLVVAVVSLDQVLHNGPRFEDTDGLAIGEGVGQSWNSAIWVDWQCSVAILPL